MCISFLDQGWLSFGLVWKGHCMNALYLYIIGPEIERKLSTCREAIKEKGAIDQTVMQGIFFGLPRSGKTSTKKRLVGKKPAVEQTSTGVAEKVSRVEIEKSTVQLLSHRTWNEVTELNDETALVIEEIVDHVAANDLEVNDGASANVSQVHRVQNAAAPKDGPIQIIVKKVKHSSQESARMPLS